ncbi:MAG: glycosyltransferase [Bryobacteraceae bacterium]|nr:glycosyltransferase [Bryobacteraceae bacterium]
MDAIEFYELALWAAIAVGFLLSFLFLRAWIAWRQLPELPAARHREAAEITVIIPARNERANIAAVIESLKPAPVLVVDDGSTDGTAELARQAGAFVIPAPPLAAGLPGKSNACLAGSTHAPTRWILFADADTRYQPDFLSSLTDYARHGNLDMVSVLLREQPDSWLERAVLPFERALGLVGVNPKNAVEVLVSGSCILFRRGAYEFIGGHKPLIAALVEDLPLAAAARRHRLKVGIVRAEALGSRRGYAGFREFWTALEKHAYRYLLDPPAKGVQRGIAALLMAAHPVIAYLLIRESPDLLGIAFAALPLALLLPWYRGAAVLLAPLAIYFYLISAVNGLIATSLGTSIRWKGRKVSAYRYVK